ncbi:6-phosphogluconolactonase [Actinotalea sp. BY-33]|uniref:6-phosphogluconolactonase n=1 Tax=Actinotalea soli TaxID=2819234 RepID=A0A939LML1_9CELL|nr:6-phosphogluconolactonase [Actinotalea soli]MBO1750336.1 6-phosphogluconolactonase [Actinotalea soli]
MSTRTVVVHPDAETLAEATAARLLLHLLDAQSTHRPLHVGLTGGTVGIKTLARIAEAPLRHAVDWTGVHLWWGDERFLPAGDPDRNETQARAALLDALPVPEENIHAMPPSDMAESPEEAARSYADELARHAPGTSDESGPAVPRFDVLLLGMGPDGHVASLFPEHDALEVTATTTVGVHGSPKPPPERVSLTFPAIEAAEEVWLVVGGADKAPAAARALAGEAVRTTPAAGALGRRRTLWLMDVAAAG